VAVPVASNILLFTLVACFSASVDYSATPRQEGQLVRGVMVAMCLQFIMLPLLGFCVVRLFALDHVTGTMLQVFCSCSPRCRV
jgi:predicted Na+-dependent transporter